LDVDRLPPGRLTACWAVGVGRFLAGVVRFVGAGPAGADGASFLPFLRAYD
jgi:hypothetical protein